VKFGFIAKHRGDLAGDGLWRRSVSRGWLLCLADTTRAAAAPADEEWVRKLPSFLASDRLWRQAVWARHAGGGCVVRTHRIERFDRLQALQSPSAAGVDCRPILGERRSPPSLQRPRPQLRSGPLPTQWIADFTHVWKRRLALCGGCHRSVLPSARLVDDVDERGPVFTMPW